ncbi:MAG: ABC transporter ATP-binding protein [Deltaproteobacteria bacterium]|nr:MAG: ABC transporter ATP-binding protein [Deltaproteobacteria bacterium]
MKHYRRLLAYLRPYVWPHGAVAVACMLAFSATESAIPFLAKFTFDQVFTQHHSGALPFAVAFVLLAAVLRGGLDFGAGYLTDWIGQRVVTDLRNQLTAHLQRLDLAFFNRRRAGQIVSRVMADVTLVRATVTDALTSLFQDITRLLGLVAVAIYMDWVLALLAVCLFPVAALPIRYFSWQLRQTSRRQQEAIGRLNALLHENAQGNRVVKAFGQERYEEQRFNEHNERLFHIVLRASVIRSLPITEVLAGIAVAGIIWLAGSSVINGTRTQGAFVGFVITLFLLYEPFKKLVRTNYTLTGVDQAIEFHDVSFAYEPGEPVLRGVNLRIPVGQVVALVGISGGGKSTLADLIPRFYDATEGRITIDGVDIRGITLASLRSHIAVVTQFTFLFNDSVRNNIAYGEPSRPMEEVVAAARAANAHDFISELPRGYETHIGDLGVRLSGGQRQRLAIARALLKNAPILILDEATSALDTESEGLVQEALERLMANRTTLVVAHRLSTVRRADRIVVLVHGEIAESGTHEELLARGAEYRKLYELQFRDLDAPLGAPVTLAPRPRPVRQVAP